MKKIFLLSVLVLSACSSQGFHQEALRSKVAGSIQVEGAEIAQALKRRPQLPSPFRLGVYFREPELKNAEGGIWNRWSVAEKDKVFAALKAKKSREVSAIFPVLSAGSNDLASIRAAAARQGADAVLVVSGASETVSNPNMLALGYALLAPLFFLHGTDVETLYLSRVALWDVRNEYLYMAAEGEGVQKDSRPAARQNEREQIEGAKAMALENLCQKIREESSGLLGSI